MALQSKKYFTLALFFVSIFVLTLVCVEFVASFFVPSWPARDLRPIFSNSPTQNSWGLEDSEHDSKKDPDTYRILFVGDSFLEGVFVPKPIHEEALAALSPDLRKKVEFINLGISATGPKHYYHRLKKLIKKLQPDAVYLFFYSGNDWVNGHFKNEELLPFIAEAPMPSILGSVMPRFNWLLVNRLKLSERDKGLSKVTIVNEKDTIKRYLAMNHPERIEKLAEHIHQYYHPDLDTALIAKTLNRASPQFWNSVHTMHKYKKDPELLQGWILRNIFNWEKQNIDPANDLESAFETVQLSEINDTYSWLDATNKLCKKHGAHFVTFLIPSIVHDPQSRDFFSYWPKYLHMGYAVDACHAVLAHKMALDQFPFIDLFYTLDNQPSTYRKTDMHWNTKGTQLVGQFVSQVTEQLIENTDNLKKITHFSQCPRDIPSKFQDIKIDTTKVETLASFDLTNFRPHNNIKVSKDKKGYTFSTTSEPWSYAAELKLDDIVSNFLDRDLMLCVSIVVHKNTVGLGIFNSSSSDFIVREPVAKGKKVQTVYIPVNSLDSNMTLVIQNWSKKSSSKVTISDISLIQVKS